MKTVPAPGLHPEMTNDEYHSCDGISKSHLDDIGTLSPKHYWAKRIDPDREEREKTPALILGSAMHTAILEPDLLDSSIISLPKDAPRRPSDRQRDAKKPSMETLEAIDFWDAFAKQAKGKIILDSDDLAMVKKARDAVHMHPVAGPLFKGGKAEQSYFAIDERTGALIKCRVDYGKPRMIVDLKSTEDASRPAFERSSEKYRYYMQDAWYRHVISQTPGDIEPIDHFVFVAIEKEWPFAVGVYYTVEEYTDDFNKTRRPLDEMRIQMNHDLDRILEHRASGNWPDYGVKPQVLRRPGWTIAKAA